MRSPRDWSEVAYPSRDGPPLLPHQSIGVYGHVRERGSYGDGLPILLPYQERWIRESAEISVCEKSRRIGLSWGDAAGMVMHAASNTGGDVYYLSYNKEMTEGYARDCTEWAGRMNKAVREVTGETVIDDDGEKTYRFRLTFPSGHHILCLPSRPRSLRSKGRPGDVVIIDEAAFCDDLEALLDAGVAVTQWGGRLRVISTHNGDESPFNELVNDVRAGRHPYALHRITLDDAIADGLARRTCTVKGDEWGPGYAAAWRAQQFAKYREPDAADQELLCIPRRSSGAWLSRALIESRMVDAPIPRYDGSPAFNALPEPARRSEIDDWLREVLAPLTDQLALHRRHVLGVDFARSGDLTVLFPIEIGHTLKRRCPFLIELWNVPYKQQEQICAALCDRLPRFAYGAFDARGNGGYLAEAMTDRYGSMTIESVQLTEAWYREQMPPYKAAFEDDQIELPRSDDVVDDHRAVKMVRGVPRLPEGKTGGRHNERHGDSAIAGALAYYASRRDGGPVDFVSAGPRESTAALDDYLGEPLPGLGGGHDLFAGYL